MATAPKPPVDFAPVPVRPRHDGWTVERQIAFVEKLADSGSITAACEICRNEPRVRAQATAAAVRAGVPRRLRRGARRRLCRSRAGGVGAGEERRHLSDLLQWRAGRRAAALRRAPDHVPAPFPPPSPLRRGGGSVDKSARRRPRLRPGGGHPLRSGSVRRRRIGRARIRFGRPARRRPTELERGRRRAMERSNALRPRVSLPTSPTSGSTSGRKAACVPCLACAGYPYLGQFGRRRERDVNPSPSLRGV